MFKAIGFDLGDTLIEYENVPLSWQSLYNKALDKVITKHHFVVSPNAIQEAEAILLTYNTRVHYRSKEVTAETIFTKILQQWGVYSAENVNNAITTFFSFFRMKINVFEDAILLLQFLKINKIKVGVFTDVPYGMPKQFVQKDIEKIQEYVDVLITSEEVGYRKPEKMIYATLAKQLGVNIEDLAYVGNEKKDVKGAKDAGLYAIFIDRKNTDITYGEDKKIVLLTELKKIFII
ncbi:MAG TPA: HAD family hydrolase [Candidatus Sulfotelmatobacter sp.]|jgi:putative hydrolase of the HAD superfamily|nr:HAD family hydrolase [Candidatus Sulfotelmatobacter sp.]